MVGATANCWTWASVLVAAVLTVKRRVFRPAEPLLKSGSLQFLSSKRNALCAALSMFVVRHGKGLFLRQLLRRHVDALPTVLIFCLQRLPPIGMGKSHQCSRGVGKAVFSTTCYQAMETVVRHHLLPRLLVAEATEEISSNVDVREKAKHHTELSR